MNSKRKILSIIIMTMLCLSISPFIKTAYAIEEDVWKDLRYHIGESNYSRDGYFTVEVVGPTIVITLLNDITADSDHTAISFSRTYSYELKLNGHTLDVDNSNAIDNGYAIKVDKGTSLKITGPGTITGGNNTGDGGAIYCEGSLTLDDVTINNCKAKNGAGVYFVGNAEALGLGHSKNLFKIDSAIIQDCYASENGGGIYADGDLNFKDLSMQFCDSALCGGGLYLANCTDQKYIQYYEKTKADISSSQGINFYQCKSSNGSAIYVEDNAICSLSDGVTIKDCIAYVDGTIYNEGVLEIQDIIISDNKASQGGGIYLKGLAYLGKNPVIKNNKNNSARADNLYLTDEGRIIFGSGTDVPSPTDGMDVNITLKTMPSEGHAINLAGNGIDEYKNYIHIDNNSPDDPNRVYIIFDGNKFVVYVDEVLPVVVTSSPKKYSTKKAETKNGSITLSKSKASKGSKVTITVVPDKGFTLETLNVYDGDGNTLELKNEDKNKYSFTMPKGNVEIEATFMEDNSMLNFCTDVKTTDDSYDAIKWAYENGITKGVSETEFGKEIEITRGQAVTFLHRAVGKPEASEEPKSTFIDVTKGEYYAEAATWAAENGITLGTGDNRFEPDRVCTVEEIATMVERFKSLVVLPTTKEEEHTPWSVDNKEQEVTRKNGSCTREEAVGILFSEIAYY